MSTTYRLQFLLIAAAAILAAAFPANAQATLEAVKQKGVLVAGSSAEYPPFEYVADGKLVGYDVDMAEEITRRMGVKVAWEKIDFKGIVAALTAKRVDVLITALTWTPERAERIAFSDTGGRLVEHQHVGVVDERARERQTAFHAARHRWIEGRATVDL